MEEEPKTQIPTIKDAVTYIVDKDGNEVKAEVESKSKLKAQSSKLKAESKTLEP
jgi:hypothetical protein